MLSRAAEAGAACWVTGGGSWRVPSSSSPGSAAGQRTEPGRVLRDTDEPCPWAPLEGTIAGRCVQIPHLRPHRGNTGLFALPSGLLPMEGQLHGEADPAPGTEPSGGGRWSAVPAGAPPWAAGDALAPPPTTSHYRVCTRGSGHTEAPITFRLGFLGPQWHPCRWREGEEGTTGWGEGMRTKTSSCQEAGPPSTGRRDSPASLAQGWSRPRTVAPDAPQCRPTVATGPL